MFIVLGVLFAPLPSEAKRRETKDAAPQVSNGVLFTAPREYPYRNFGYVEASDAATKKKLWRALIFHVEMDPALEEDVQWVFISGLECVDGGLIVTAEDGSIFSLDLKTKEVKQIKKGSAKLLPPFPR